MDKEQKAKEYISFLHKETEVYLGRKCEPKDIEYHNGDMVSAYITGWDDALKSLLVDASKELPEYDEAVWVINACGDQFYCHRSKEDIVNTDKCGWCNYTCSDIIAWIRPTSFKEILEMNKDVLMRLKDM
jgi:hypothetical protein